MPYTRVCVYVKKWRDSEFANDLSHRAHIYKYTISQLRYNHVIIMSYLKRCCVLMWCYVFAIKLKYYGRKKVRHIAIPLHYSNGSHICISIIIQFSKKSHFIIKHVGIKKEIRIDFLHRASYISPCTDHSHHISQ